MPATVLIADDEPHMLRLIEFTFRKGGYDLVLARNGREAVDLARVHLPGLVVLDMQMPEMDGLTALKTLKADPITAAIPVILLSARGHHQTVQPVPIAFPGAGHPCGAHPHSGPCLTNLVPILP